MTLTIMGLFVTFNINKISMTMLEPVALNKSSLVLKNILQSPQILQLFTMNIKTDFFYKSYLKFQAAKAFVEKAYIY
jgi:hypothetical protein